jgi:uncharacterized membrane protein YccC
MNELVPILCGTLVGLWCDAIRDSRWRASLWVVLSVICGAAATLVSGEFKLGWEYLFIDVALAAGAALGTLTLASSQVSDRAHDPRANLPSPDLR